MVRIPKDEQRGDSKLRGQSIHPLAEPRSSSSLTWRPHLPLNKATRFDESVGKNAVLGALIGHINNLLNVVSKFKRDDFSN
jgi:hypothetical protein